MSRKKFHKIPGFSNYAVSRDGEVVSLDNNKILSPLQEQDDDYLYVMLYKNSEPHKHKVHHLVADAFIDNPDGLPLVNHIDGNKTNNKVDNLEWADHSKNTKHAYDHGMSKPAKGESNGKSKLTDAQVKTIRKSDKSLKKLSDLYDVSPAMISLIKNGKNWTHV